MLNASFCLFSLCFMADYNKALDDIIGVKGSFFLKWFLEVFIFREL